MARKEVPGKVAGVRDTWRRSEQIRGVKSRLTAAINTCNSGAYVTIDMKTAINLIEVCDQAIHTEEGHGV